MGRPAAHPMLRAYCVPAVGANQLPRCGTCGPCKTPDHCSKAVAHGGRCTTRETGRWAAMEGAEAITVPSREGSATIGQPGRSSDSRALRRNLAREISDGTYWLRLLGPLGPMTTVQRSFPVTAAGPFRLLTGFPILPAAPSSRTPVTTSPMYRDKAPCQGVLPEAQNVERRQAERCAESACAHAQMLRRAQLAPASRPWRHGMRSRFRLHA